MGRAKQICIFEHAQNAQIQIHSTHEQSCSPVKHYVVSSDSVSGR